MLYTEDIDGADAIGRAAQMKIKELGVPANPMNYTIWYCYFSRAHPDLTSVIDEMLSSGEAFSTDRVEAIHARFFGFEDDGTEVLDAGNAIQLKVDEIVDQINQAGLANSDFGLKLGRITEGLGEGTDPEVLNRVIREVLRETREVVTKGKVLERKLDESSKEISQLREHLKAVRLEAMSDGLTGIANRKGFDQRLGEEAFKAKGAANELCLLIIDIDHFKKFNDTFGHQIGDSVLKIVARHLRDSIKGQDLAARYGGEEFGVILPETSLADAATLAEGIRAKLAKKELKNTKTNDSYGRVTISVGVARRRDNESLNDFVQRADEALYAAKQAGRNRVATELQLPAKFSMAG